MSCSGHVGVDAVIDVGHECRVRKGVERGLQMTYRVGDDGGRGRRPWPFELFDRSIYPAEADTQISDATVRRIDHAVSLVRINRPTSRRKKKPKFSDFCHRGRDAAKCGVSTLPRHIAVVLFHTCLSQF